MSMNETSDRRGGPFGRGVDPTALSKAWVAVAAEIMDSNIRLLSRSLELMTTMTGAMPLEQKLELQRKGLQSAFDAQVKDVQKIWSMAIQASSGATPAGGNGGSRPLGGPLS